MSGSGPARPDTAAVTRPELDRKPGPVPRDEQSAPPSEPLWPPLSKPTDLALIETVPLSARGLPASTYEALRRAATLWPAHRALTVLSSAAQFRGGVTRTFADLLADVHRTANALTAAGVTRSSAVGLLSPNNDQLLTATLAAQAAGIAAPVNPGLSIEHLTGILQRAAASVLIAAGPEINPAGWTTARHIAATLNLRSLLALRPTGSTHPPPDLQPLGEVHVAYLEASTRDHPDTHLTAARPQATDLAAFFHTGGTTGTPKLAAHTHANQISDAWMLAVSSDLDQHATVFAALPLFHVNAMIVTVLAPLLRGRHTVWSGPLGFREPAFYEQFWNIVEHYSIATLSAVPTVYAALAQRPVDADIRSLRFAAVGASPLPPAVRQAFETRTGVELAEGYGLTEATCASARQLPGHQRPGSVGQRLPYQRIKAVRVDGSDAARSEAGLLMISGPTVFAGYVTGRDNEGPVLDSRGSVDDGWLATGDLGWVDSDGFVHVSGRAKDVIIRGGHNIDPGVVEDAVLSHPDVTGANAVGKPDQHAGEVPAVYVTVRAASGVTPAELLAWAADHAPERAAVPKEVVILDALPVTDVGKPYKIGLRHDAILREATRALRRAGLHSAFVHHAAVHGASAHGANASASATVTTADADVAIVVDAGTDAADAITEALAPYAFAWRMAEPTQPAPGQVPTVPSPDTARPTVAGSDRPDEDGLGSGGRRAGGPHQDGPDNTPNGSTHGGDRNGR